MQRVVPAVLIASRVLASLAVLVALLEGLLLSTLVVGFTCFDSCPTRAQFFSNRVLGTLTLLSPCIVLAALALALFFVHCFATRQLRRALIVLLFFLLGGLLGVAVLTALAQYGQATPPVDEESDVLVAGPVVAWAQQWGLAVLLIGVVWSGGLSGLQWGREWSAEWGQRWRRLNQRATP
jgi:hypothetical protein